MQNEERFARHIREYYKERLRVEFITSEFGFVGFSTDGTDVCINEWYMQPNTALIESLRLVRQVVAIGKQRGCNRLIGGNETTLPTYKNVRKFHEWFRMSYLGDNGTLELWGKPI
jgi:hypothetical protein